MLGELWAGHVNPFNRQESFFKILKTPPPPPPPIVGRIWISTAKDLSFADVALLLF